MKSLKLTIIIPFFMKILNVGSFSGNADVSKSDYRIIGGQDVPPGVDHAFVVSIEENGEHLCAGSILNERSVITAGHCIKLFDNFIGIEVHAGDLTLTLQHGKKYKVKHAMTHPHYNPKTYNNDLGLIRLILPIVFNERMHPIPLAKHCVILRNIMTTMFGWGRMATHGNVIPNDLKMANVPMWTFEDCKNYYGPYFTSTMICGGDISNYVRHQWKDSGGPLVYNGELLGIISIHGDNYAEINPDVFTNVALFRTWIDESLREYGEIF